MIKSKCVSYYYYLFWNSFVYFIDEEFLFIILKYKIVERQEYPL